MVFSQHLPFPPAKTHKSTRIGFIRQLLMVTLALGIALPSTLPAQPGLHYNRFAAGHILVKPRNTVNDAQFTAVTARHGGLFHRRMRSTQLHIVDVAPGQEESTAQALAVDPQVEFAEVDRLVDPEIIIPNDPDYSVAWHLATIGAPAAWDIAKGKGVTVAILDSGIDPTHPDLAGKLVPGYNLVDNNTNTSDVYGHGTMVAGVVGALSNNGLGVTSIAGEASLMPVRVALTSGSAYISTIADGIIYAADHGAQIANASFATLTGSPSIQSAANYMRSKGGLVVVAAGNYGVLDATPNTSSVISVSATNRSDALTSWSSFGPYVDVSAPGEGIWTTTNGGGYAAVSGTSFSSPATCAVLALMKSANPSLSNTVLESLLESTAVDLGTPGYDQYFGYGRINAAAAVAAAASYAVVSDTQAPTVSISSPSGSTVSSSVTVNLTANDNVGVTRVDLYAGATLVGTTSTAPYSVNWDTKTAANGAVSLVAYAYDKAGNKGTSPTTNVTVANFTDRVAPSVKITAPTGGMVSSTVTVTVSATDAVGVTRVDLYLGTTLIGSRNTTPYKFTWDTKTVANGTYTLTAYASDMAGNKGAAAPVTVKVANPVADTTPPVVTLSGLTVTSGTVSIKAAASDNVRVASLAIYIDGALKTSTTATRLSYVWNTRKVNKGAHSISAIAKDAAGNSSTKTLYLTVGASTAARTR